MVVAALGRPDCLFALDKGHQHLHGLVCVAVLEVLQDCHPHQVLLYARDLILRSWQRAHLLADCFYEFVPCFVVVAVDCSQLLLPQHRLPLQFVLLRKELKRPLVLLHDPAEVRVLVDARQRQFDFPELGRVALLVGRGGRDPEGEFRLSVPFVLGVVGDGLLELVAGEREGARPGSEEDVDERRLGEELVLALEADLRIGS